MSKGKTLEHILKEGYSSISQVLGNKKINNILEFIEAINKIYTLYIQGLIPNFVVKLEKQSQELYVLPTYFELKIGIPENISIKAQPKTVKDLKEFLSQIITFLARNPSQFPLFKEIQESFGTLDREIKSKRNKIKELMHTLNKLGRKKEMISDISSIEEFLSFLDKNLELLEIANYEFSTINENIAEKILINTEGTISIKENNQAINLPITIPFKTENLSNIMKATTKNQLNIKKFKTLISNKLLKDYLKQLSQLLKTLNSEHISFKEIMNIISRDIQGIPQIKISEPIRKLRHLNKLILIFEILKLIKDFNFQNQITITITNSAPYPDYDYYNRDILDRNFKNSASLQVEIPDKKNQNRVLEFRHIPMLRYNEILRVSEDIINELRHLETLLKKVPTDEELPKLIEDSKRIKQNIIELTASLKRKFE